MPSFEDNFWGEKNNGFDVLYQNMKHGATSSKELVEFLRESCTIEETYSKALGKLANKAGNFSAVGTFSPFWQALKTLAEKLSILHAELVHQWQDLIKEVQKYTDTLNKKHKQVKESEAATSEVVQAIQQTIVALHKSKETYQARCLDYEKLKRENAAQKDIEKAEVKFKKASEDYRSFVEKYANIRNDFESKMTDSCRNFQEIEVEYLSKMKDFIDSYARALGDQHVKKGEVQEEFRNSCCDLAVEKLLETFIEGKSTGQEKPGPIEFEEADLSSLPPPAASPDLSEKRESIEKQRKEDVFMQITDNITGYFFSSPLVKVWTPNSHFMSDILNMSASCFSRFMLYIIDLFIIFFNQLLYFFLITFTLNVVFVTSLPLLVSPVGSNPVHRPLICGATIKACLLFLSETASNLADSKERGLTTVMKIQSLMHLVWRLDMEQNEQNEQGEDAVHAPEVDEEGFRIRPEEAPATEDKDGWFSSSESESDHEDEKRKIKVEIRPLGTKGPAATGTVEDIRASMGNLRLSPTASKRRSAAMENGMKRSQSVSETMHVKKQTNSVVDLLDIDFNPSSSASTPTGGNYSSFPSPLLPGSTTGESSASTTPVTATGEAFGPASSESSPALSTRPRSNTPSGSLDGTSVIPGPPTGRPRSNTPSGSLDGTTAIPGPPPRPRPNTPSGSLDGAPALPGPPAPRPVPRTKPGAPQVSNRPSGMISPAFGRIDSQGSLSSATFNTTSAPVGASRGPSPLTIGLSDTIPLAIAFTETVNAYFKGSDESRCLVKITGDLMMSFPAGIVKAIMDNPAPAVLSFRIKNIHQLEQVISNKQLVTEEPTDNISRSSLYSFNMSALAEHLKMQSETNKSASYFNIDILKYQVRTLPGVQSTPLQIVTYWKCEPSSTDLRVDYRYNGAAMSKPSPLTGVSVAVPVDGDVQLMQSIPPGTWSQEHKRAMWKLNEISDMGEDGGTGNLRAKFELADGPSSPGAVAVQFSCENTTISGIDFELSGTGYRLSLSKKRFSSGKYLAETDSEVRYV
ncbi:F-BAR domain only protein 2 [Lingula anatina]|uniref:F-BAR domain only protein 2 n=1 Tax=Lingula anatina TaxID=7574 RepID=A0A1S3IGI9_LINAN|nr:F-BAR domain only protein 2 [Lingula anatina]|eukprot:XP_013396584.1 F-BAR domain only protein 2 [Lingula anatina]